MRFESKEDLAGKVDWEGGVMEAITGYGISPDELPEDTPNEIVRAWRRLYKGARQDRDIVSNWLWEA